MANDRFKELAQFLKVARMGKKLSQLEVAHLLGYNSSQFVSNWERGLASPPIAMLRRLAKIYGVSGEELFSLILSETERQMRKEFRQGNVG
jgi:transcriptional regulator with XRE-family HTH domain